MENDERNPLQTPQFDNPPDVSAAFPEPVSLEKPAEPADGLFPQPEQLSPMQPENPPEQPETVQPEQPQPVVYASDYDRMMALPPISRQEAEACRHRLEKRWYRRLIELNILIIVFVIGMVIANFDTYPDKIHELTSYFLTSMQEDTDSTADEADSTAADSEDADTENADTEAADTEDADTEDADTADEEAKAAAARRAAIEKQEQDEDFLEDYAKHFPQELKFLAYGVFTLIFFFFALYLNFASVKASSVKITQRNFPEIYSLIHSYAYRLGMKKVPEAYIVQQSGVLNAFSSFIFGRQYVLINTEIFEVAYREHHDMNALAFIIAHEVAHIYYKHATLHYNLPILFAEDVPIFGHIASRTREYSCDRLAQRLTNYDGVDAIMMLMVDRHLYPLVDKQDYIDVTAQDHGFCLWLLNLLSTHPIMPKRIRALVQWTGSGELY